MSSHGSSGGKTNRSGVQGYKHHAGGTKTKKARARQARKIAKKNRKKGDLK